MKRFLAVKGTRTVDWFHRELGKIMWDYCGMERSDPGSREGDQRDRRDPRSEFERDVLVPGDEGVNQSLERAGRVTDFFGLAELMCRDAFEREESCGGHFKVEYQTEEGEALRNDVTCAHVSAWMFAGDDAEPDLVQEPLEFEYVKLAQRSYK